MPPKSVAAAAAGAAGAAAGGGAAADLAKYQKMTDREHILKKPDTYIGTIEPTEMMEYVMDAVPPPSTPFDAVEGGGVGAAPMLTQHHIYSRSLQALRRRNGEYA